MATIAEAQEKERGDARGRGATRPRDIPARGWRDVLWRVWGELGDDNVSMVAAGVAFYALLAMFPGLAALVSIYGLLAEPAEVQQQIGSLALLLPQDAQALINEQLKSIVSSSETALGIGFVVALLAAIWSAAKGVKSLITALNIVYDEEEKRGFIKLNAVALLLTAGAVLFVAMTLVLIVIVPALLGNLGLQELTKILVSWLRWPLLLVSVLAALAVLYRYGPSRSEPRWRWVSWGAAVATVLWIAGSALFSWYVSNFGSYNETYGSLGAVVILLMWFWLSAYVVLLGAELNAELEHQTREDTTVGGSQPLGDRGAYVADTVGRKAAKS